MNLQLAYRYILSLSKNESMFKKKKNDQERRKKSFRQRESNPKPLTCKGNAFSIAPRQPLLIIGVKLIILFLPMKFCWWTLFEVGRALFKKN